MLNHLHPELADARYVVFVDAKRRYTDCSDDVCELVGYDRSEILDMTIDDLSFNRTEVSSLFEKYIQSGLLDGEYLLRHKNGAPVLIRFYSWVFADGCHAAAWEPAEPWEQLYLAALIETHPATLRDKINLALTAIQKRQLNQGLKDAPETRKKLLDAVGALRSLLSN